MKRIIFLLAAVMAALTISNCSTGTAQPAGTPSESSGMTAVVQPDTTADPELRRYHELVELLLDVKLTHEQRVELSRYFNTYRYSNNPEREQASRNVMALYENLMNMSQAERLAQCRHLRSVTLNEQWKNAKSGDAEANYMLDLYYRAHPPIAPGLPPLTKDIVDALMEFDYFFNVEVKGVKAEPMDADFREKMYREAIAKWKSLDAAGQQEMFESASKVSLYRIQWANTGPEDRLLIKANVVGENNLSREEKVYLAQIKQTLMQMNLQMNQMLQNHRSQILNNELQFMRESQQTIMGNGTHWNPTLGRWEQQGGIVTEYGVTRVN